MSVHLMSPNNNVKISICVPTFNGEEFIAECLESIRAQLFGDFEVIIVDDGSSDQTLAIASGFAQDDARFIIYSNDRNLGLVGNWNRCIALASGEWIKFVFQDDLIDPDCIEAMLREAQESRCRFIVCSRRVLYENANEHLKSFHRAHNQMLKAIFAEGRTMSPSEYSATRSEYFPGIPNLLGEPTATLIHRTLFAAHGVFDAALVQLCDSEMWDRIATNVGVSYIGTELATFRVHAGSASGANRRRIFRSQFVDRLIILHKMCAARPFAAFRSACSGIQLRALRRYADIALFDAMDRIRWHEKTPNGALTRFEFDSILSDVEGLRPNWLRYLRFRIARRLLG